MSLNGFLCHSSCLLPSTYLYLSVPRPDAKLLCLIGTDVFFSLYHYYQDKYPQLSQHPSRDFEEIVSLLHSLLNEKIKLVLSGLMKSLVKNSRYLKELQGLINQRESGFLLALFGLRKFPYHPFSTTDLSSFPRGAKECLLFAVQLQMIIRDYKE
jgi:hypothetical protein